METTSLLLAYLLAAIRQTDPWEFVAAAFAVVYLVLAIRQNILCWAAAILSTSIYILVMYEAGLYMESLLQVFYVAVAVYGWWTWCHGGTAGDELSVTSWPRWRHLISVGVILTLTALSGLLLSRYTSAAFPYLDSFTTWGAIVTTWLVARKILENWHYWFVIDSISVYLYLSRELYITALLFITYLAMIFFGYRAWRHSMVSEDSSPLASPAAC